MSNATVLPPPNVTAPVVAPATPVHQLPYATPRTSVGMSLIWYPHGEQHNPGMPAIVVEVGQRTVSLTVFLPQRGNVMYKDGVRHVGDPAAKAEEFRDSGCWDYSSQTKEIMAIKSELEALKAAIA